MINLTLGILTYNAPKTLKNTLYSIFDKGVNAFFNEILIYVNPSPKLDETIDVINQFNIKSHLADANKWIASGFKWMVENSKSSNILLLEDDFVLIEHDVDKTFKILKTATDFVQTGIADVARFRSRKNAGNPLYSSWFAGQEHKCMTHLAECVHWRENPDKDFPDFCKKINEDPVWYKFNSKNANFTNNPCLYRTSFYQKHIIPKFCIDNTDIETNATSWWTDQDFTVIQGDGLFCHDRLDGK